MAAYDNILVKNTDGILTVATSADSIAGGPSFSAEQIADGTGDGTLGFDGSDNLATGGTVASITMAATGALDIDAGAASALSVASANLTLETTTSGTVAVTSAGLMDLNAAANLDIDVTGTWDVLATGAMSLDATGASNVSVASGSLTLSTTTSGVLALDGVDGVTIAGNAAEIDLTTTGALDLNSGAGTWDASTLSIDSTDNSNLTMTANDGSDKTLTIAASNSGGGNGLLDMDADVATLDTTGTFDATFGDSATFTAPAGDAAALVFDAGGADYLTIDSQKGMVAFDKPIGLEAADGSTAIVQGGLLAGETVAAGDLVSLDFSTDTRVYKCDANHATAVLRNPVGVCVAGNTVGLGVAWAFGGIVSVKCTQAVAAGSALIGDFVYADDATAGQVTTTAPTSGRVYKVGVLVGDNGNVANAAAAVLLQPQFLYDN